MSDPLPKLNFDEAERAADRAALIAGEARLTYGDLAGQVGAFAGAVLKESHGAERPRSLAPGGRP